MTYAGFSLRAFSPLASSAMYRSVMSFVSRPNRLPKMP